MKLEPTAAELKFLTQNSIPIPGSNNKKTRDLLRKCFASHGDFFREIGISNFRTFQPDWQYFESSSSNGWRKFMSRLTADAEREEVLTKAAHVILRKLSLLTHKMKPAMVIKPLESDQVGIAVELANLADKTMEIKVGPNIYRAVKITESADDVKLVTSVVKDLEGKAEGIIKGYGAEFANNLKLVRTQYEKTISDLKAKMDVQMPALKMPLALLKQGIMADTGQGRYVFYVPIHLHYKYIASGYHVWQLKKKYQLEQDGYLHLEVSPKWQLYHSGMLDTKLGDTLELWHMSGGICFGSYKFKMTQVDDLLKIRNDIAKMLETINTHSIGRRNIHSTAMKKIEHVRRNCNYKRFQDNKKDDMDLSEIATLPSDKIKGGGKIWST